MLTLCNLFCKLQQISFLYIQTLHSDCSHIEDVHLISGADPGFLERGFNFDLFILPQCIGLKINETIAIMGRLILIMLQRYATRLLLQYIDYLRNKKCSICYLYNICCTFLE